LSIELHGCRTDLIIDSIRSITQQGDDLFRFSETKFDIIDDKDSSFGLESGRARGVGYES